MQVNKTQKEQEIFKNGHCNKSWLFVKIKIIGGLPPRLTQRERETSVPSLHLSVIFFLLSLSFKRCLYVRGISSLSYFIYFSQFQAPFASDFLTDSFYILRVLQFVNPFFYCI